MSVVRCVSLKGAGMENDSVILNANGLFVSIRLELDVGHVGNFATKSRELASEIIKILYVLKDSHASLLIFLETRESRIKMQSRTFDPVLQA